MEVIIQKTAADAVNLTARIMADALRHNPEMVFGLATGATMEAVYAELTRMHREEGLDFSSAKSEMELIARKTVMELEGEEGIQQLEEYCDFSTERGKKLRKTISKKLHFSSLDFQSLEGIIKAIGIDPCKLCTYCWNGKEN